MSGLREDRITISSGGRRRLLAVETALGKGGNKVRGAIHVRFVDYTFQAGWLILGGVLAYGVNSFALYFSISCNPAAGDFSSAVFNPITQGSYFPEWCPALSIFSMELTIA